MNTIKGRRVILTPATLHDRRQIYTWLAESDITAKMIGPPDFADNPVPAWQEFVDDYNPHFFDDRDADSGRSFIISVQGEPVGHINYNEIDRNTDAVELDIWLAGSHCCNKGYGTDAIDALCAYLFSHLRCRMCILAPSARNAAAIRAYEKCGFRPVTEPPPGFIPDYHDTVVMVKSIGS